MNLINRKWKNIITLSTIFFLFAMLFKVIPEYSEIIASTVNIIFSGDIKEEVNESDGQLKQLNMEKMKLIKYSSSLVSNNKNSNLSSIISLLDNSAEKSGSKIINIDPREAEEKNDLYFQPIGIVLNADYEKIFNFVRFLENSERVIRIKNLTLKEKESKHLIVNIELEAYLNL